MMRGGAHGHAVPPHLIEQMEQLGGESAADVHPKSPPSDPKSPRHSPRKQSGSGMEALASQFPGDVSRFGSWALAEGLN